MNAHPIYEVRRFSVVEDMTRFVDIGAPNECALFGPKGAHSWTSNGDSVNRFGIPKDCAPSRIDLNGNLWCLEQDYSAKIVNANGQITYGNLWEEVYWRYPYRFSFLPGCIYVSNERRWVAIPQKANIDDLEGVDVDQAFNKFVALKTNNGKSWLNTIL